jgi:hypothetical protein
VERLTIFILLVVYGFLKRASRPGSGRGTTVTR